MLAEPKLKFNNKGPQGKLTRRLHELQELSDERVVGKAEQDISILQNLYLVYSLWI